jgi:hypothetical protein
MNNKILNRDLDIDCSLDDRSVLEKDKAATEDSKDGRTTVQGKKKNTADISCLIHG